MISKARHTKAKSNSRLRLAGLLLSTLGLLSASGCGGDPFWLPRAHKIEVQQGNLITEAQREKLVVGMSRQEVLSVLGHPVQEPDFRADQWDYVYTRTPAGDTTTARRLTVRFTDDQVSDILDNQTEVSGEIPLRSPWWEFGVGRTGEGS